MPVSLLQIGYNNQILHIACKHKRQQYWLTPGDERTTMYVLYSCQNAREVLLG